MRCDYKANAAVTATQVKKQGLAVTPKALPPAPSNHGLTPPPPERGNGLIFVPGMAWPCCAVSPPSGGSQVLRCHRVCLGSSRCYFSVGLETHPVPAPPPAPPPPALWPRFVCWRVGALLPAEFSAAQISDSFCSSAGCPALSSAHWLPGGAPSPLRLGSSPFNGTTGAPWPSAGRHVLARGCRQGITAPRAPH